MIPIPAQLLDSTVYVRVPKDSLYGGEYENPVKVERVCFQSAAAIRAKEYQLQAPLKGVLIVDPKRSLNAFEIPAGSMVRLEGEESESCVHECIPVPSAKTVHHWEVTLV